jgi:hypothetical protein
MPVGQDAEKRGEHQRHLGGQSGIVLRAVDVAGHRECGGGQDHRRSEPGIFDGRRDRPGQRKERECPDAPGFSVRAGSLAALALDADQQPDTERCGQADDVR